ncbi:MAG: ubiquinol-cytochrome C chaperone [Devosia nanyangense]|uniref:Ubiquinol-cytochrome C chaperone n=1 Tax=Devosia nanyangense TaxID=1228055 RepID=A0A933L212_9HYPH|nr:ubiquinol-cytochrome C chaperone [Devosia nanyangense]
MIFNLFRKSPAPDAAYEAYRSIVAQSRRPVFYADWGVPDTVTGRFDMISLHLALLLRRLKGAPEAQAFTQALVDLFFRDMDRSLRELGVTDLGVPRKVKTMGNIFYGLVDVLAEVLDTGDAAAVEAVLVKNVYGGAATAGAAPLAAYLCAEASALAAEPTGTLVAGRRTDAAA